MGGVGGSWPELRARGGLLSQVSRASPAFGRQASGTLHRVQRCVCLPVSAQSLLLYSESMVSAVCVKLMILVLVIFLVIYFWLLATLECSNFLSVLHTIEVEFVSTVHCWA